MTPQIATLLIILVIALLLFSLEWLAVDVVALGVLLALAVTGLVSPAQTFAGFGSDTALMILGLFVLTAALARTGTIEIAGRMLMRRIADHPTRALLVVMSASAGLSTFMSNTAATAFFTPIVMGMARRLRISASRLLMPLAFSAILASSVTLISTSTNLVVSGLMTQFGLEPLGMFELSPVGIPVVISGLVYMILIGRKVIPERIPPEEELTQEFNLRPYLTELEILPDSSLVGKSLAESGLGRVLDYTVLRIQRGKQMIMAPQADFQLQAGDELLVEGQRDEILKVKEVVGARVISDVPFSDPDLQAGDMQLAEVIIMPRSPLIGRRLVGLDLRERYGLQVLAINRHEGTIHRKVGQVPLQMGDVLLIQGLRYNLDTLEKNNTFRVLRTMEDKSPHPRRAWIALFIFVGALALGVSEVVSLPVAVLIGALGMFISRCITPEEAYREVEWKAIILIGSMLAFGAAMESTGTAGYLAKLIVGWTAHAEPVWILSGFFLLTVLLTQPMSNQAAAAVVLPVAMQTAVHLGLNPRTFAAMVAVAASTSYITPLEPACLIIYGLGRYRFLDFLRVGFPLTILVYLIAIFLVPMFWPL